MSLTNVQQANDLLLSLLVKLSIWGNEDMSQDGILYEFNETFRQIYELGLFSHAIKYQDTKRNRSKGLGAQGLTTPTAPSSEGE